MTRRTADNGTPPPSPPAAVAMTTVGGYAVGILGFIPVDGKDLKKQVEVSTLILDINEGRKTIADLAPFMVDVSFRQNFVRRRFEAAELSKALADLAEKTKPKAPASEDQKTDA